MKALGKAEDGQPAVEIVAVCPGATVSEISRDYSQWYMSIAKAVFGFLLLKSTEAGSRTYISGTLLNGTGHGRFWSADRIKEYVLPASSLSIREAVQATSLGVLLSALRGMWSFFFCHYMYILFS